MITLTKPSDSTPTPTTEQAPTSTTRRPWYPLVGHRRGLRSNDLTTLASALFVLAIEGGTAHVAPANRY